MTTKREVTIHINPSFDFKKTLIKLFTVGCLFGVTGCGGKQKEYQPDQSQNKIEIQTDEQENTNMADEEKIERYISMGESENPLKVLIVENNVLEPIHFGYFRQDKEIVIENEKQKTIYKAYFDDILTGEEIDLGKNEQENNQTRYYYQLASRYFDSSKITENKIEKRVLEEFIEVNQQQTVQSNEYYRTFAEYDVYRINPSDISYHVVAGSLYSNELEETRKNK